MVEVHPLCVAQIWAVALSPRHLSLPSSFFFLSFDARLLAVEEEEEEEEEGKEECENIMVIGADVARLLPNLTRRRRRPSYLRNDPTDVVFVVFASGSFVVIFSCPRRQSTVTSSRFKSRE